ncbi:putative transcription factor bHLH041 isoform X2 [Phragmites australis]|uniref:putative transcription factor bHLH041 isoform X2 n=1 Tax=Phragmites australis TaxID=29695 RepID=UPI002D778FB6|nr:putative transcription factor bHLH041 isoform X2 [Phragmites australis]
MDTLFVLGQESRLRILQQAAARVPGCAYLCAWAPLPAQPASSSSSSSAATSARLLCCLDAWLCNGGAGRGDGGRARLLFDEYRRSLCAAVSGCVPGWAYNDGRAYIELPAHDLTSSASLPVQLQFYQMAAFMGCESGEIEVGMSTAASGSPISLEASLQQVFSEDFFQQSLLEELLHLPPTRPSSPSSSLPSVSVDSPAAEGSTSLLRTMAVTSAATSSSVERKVPVPLLLHPRPPLPVPFGRHGHVHFPSAEADDAAMAQAMLAVISATSSSALLTSSTTTPPPGNHRACRSPRRLCFTAFRPYNAAFALRAPRRLPGKPGQRMIKMGISILRRMHMLRFSRESTTGAAMAQPPAPTSSQLNHMISERRRRERLNESFEALRGLLPPGSKKDKATVLAKTLEYMNILVAQIADLEARNRSLQTRANQRANGGSKERSYSSEQQVVLQAGLSGTPERVQVHVSGGASTSSSSSSGPREVTVRVAEGDVSELVARVLAAIKEMGCFTVVVVDARRASDGIAQATFTLRATAAGEFDEASLREAVTKAAEDSATPPSDYS